MVVHAKRICPKTIREAASFFCGLPLHKKILAIKPNSKHRFWLLMSSTFKMVHVSKLPRPPKCVQKSAKAGQWINWKWPQVQSFVGYWYCASLWAFQFSHERCNMVRISGCLISLGSLNHFGTVLKLANILQMNLEIKTKSLIFFPLETPLAIPAWIWQRKN